jgi:dihydrofolate synthase / folylpolyglutamate synthase
MITALCSCIIQSCMNIQAIKTEKIYSRSHTIHQIIDSAISTLPEKSVVVVTSKIISLCEGRTIKIGDIDKTALIEQESDYYIPKTSNPHDVTLTLTKNLLVPSAGIDESNGNGYYVLWPSDPHSSAKSIREYLSKKFGVRDVGVIITDSRTTPMRWGVTGIALSYAGFAGLNDFIGAPDIFNRPLTMTKVNVADGLAAAAVLCMGESNEQTPIAVATDMDFIRFDPDKPTDIELKEWQISMEEDIYGPLLTLGPWIKGKK